MKTKNWIFTSLIIATIGFIVSWILVGNWKVGLTLGVISGLITLAYNPVTRYMRAFWSVLSLLIGINSFSLKFVSDFYNSFSSGNIQSEIGNSSITLSILLAILCVVLVILDFFERNKTSKSKRVKMVQKGGSNSKNYQSKGNINVTNNDKR
jgi:hypothetical protein